MKRQWWAMTTFSSATVSLVVASAAFSCIIMVLFSFRQIWQIQPVSPTIETSVVKESYGIPAHCWSKVFSQTSQRKISLTDWWQLSQVNSCLAAFGVTEQGSLTMTDAAAILSPSCIWQSASSFASKHASHKWSSVARRLSLSCVSSTFLSS